jgi:predicted phosphate transport protein (TIGR00153 family)
MRFRLVPVDEKFFELFAQAGSNGAECARRLRDQLREAGAPGGVVECERRGDQLTRDLLHRLNTSFVTPFDREDIHALAEELDDVVDDMLEVSLRLPLAQRSSQLPELDELADVLVQMAEQTEQLMGVLQPMKGVQPFLEEIDRLESEGDSIYRRALSRLFSGEFEALEVLKWKDVIEALEGALNTMEDVSNVVESIVLKHA